MLKLVVEIMASSGEASERTGTSRGTASEGTGTSRGTERERIRGSNV